MICIWLAVTLTVGRGWCSWICFYGGWEEGFSHVAKKRRLNLIPKNKEMREIHFGFFFFIILASLCQFACVYCEWFCPFKLTTEFFPMNSIPSLIAGVMFIGLFLALVVVLPILTKRRTQCSILCPFGAFASLTDRFSLFKIKIDSQKCTGCLKFANSCPFGAIDILTIQEKKEHPEITCAKCGECINACPQKAIRYEFRFNSNKEKCGCGKRKMPKTSLGQTIQELLEPSELFRFAAFSFAVIMSSGFVDQSLGIIFNAVTEAF
ncbi:MAG: 4Fe-4S binding protein [Treponema sp.]|nr:4Fe-4S binding protein [Treponema sp.]